MSVSDRITQRSRSEEAKGKQPRPAEASVVDWDHLSRQSFGDGELERELLRLFSDQAASFEARLAEPAQDDARRREIAHTLQGSARAIGAFALANAAQNYEEALNGAPDECAARRRELSRRLDEAREAVAARLERA